MGWVESTLKTWGKSHLSVQSYFFLTLSQGGLFVLAKFLEELMDHPGAGSSKTWEAHQGLSGKGRWQGDERCWGQDAAGISRTEAGGKAEKHECRETEQVGRADSCTTCVWSSTGQDSRRVPCVQLSGLWDTEQGW